MLVLGIAQLNYSCTPETNPPFLAKLGINADSLMNKPFPKVVLNVDSIGLPLNESEFYSLTLDSVHYMRIVSWKKIGNNYIVFLVVLQISNVFYLMRTVISLTELVV